MPTQQQLHPNSKWKIHDAIFLVTRGKSFNDNNYHPVFDDILTDQREFELKRRLKARGASRKESREKFDELLALGNGVRVNAYITQILLFCSMPTPGTPKSMWTWRFNPHSTTGAWTYQDLLSKGKSLHNLLRYRRDAGRFYFPEVTYSSSRRINSRGERRYSPGVKHVWGNLTNSAFAPHNRIPELSSFWKNDGKTFSPPYIPLTIHGRTTLFRSSHVKQFHKKTLQGFRTGSFAIAGSGQGGKTVLTPIDRDSAFSRSDYDLVSSRNTSLRGASEVPRR
jgi:hypothetical protein